MKKILIWLLICGALSVQSATVWWVHSFSEKAVVHGKNGTYSIIEYAEKVLGDSLFNVAYMVKDVANGTYLDFWFDGYEPDSVNWVEGSGDGHPYIREQQVSINAEVELVNNIEDWTTFSRDWTDELLVELHLYDENTDSFTRFAVSDIFTLEDIKKDLYGQGSIDEPAVATIKFRDFYTDDYVPPVPEPSVVLLGLIGLCVCLFRRKSNI